MQSEAGKTAYKYDEKRQISEKISPCGIKTTYTHDEFGRIKSVRSNKGYKELEYHEYKYDASGNIISINKRRDGVPEDSGMFKYSYDQLNRLTEIIKGDSHTIYEYDLFGNRTLKTVDGIKAIYNYNELNQLLSIETDAHIEEFRYNKNGRLVNKIVNGNIIGTFDYDLAGRLKRSIISGIGEEHYNYDGFGNRVSRLEKHMESDTITEQKSCFTVDMTKQYNNLIMCKTGNETQKFIWGRKDLLSSEFADSGNHFDYICDHLGSPIRIDDSKWDVAFAYDEFGIPTVSKGIGALKSQNPFGFTGYMKESFSGLNYAQSRYYQPETGRFQTEDPIRSGFNWYSYCGNNPLIYTDPLGFERVIVSGGAMGESYNNQFSFVDAALNDIVSMPDRDNNKTILLCTAGFTDEDISNAKEEAEKYINTTLVPFDTTEELINYINTKDINGNGGDTSKRSDDKITYVTWYSHGNEGNILFTYDIPGLTDDEKNNLKFNTTSIGKMESEAFDNATTVFFACNTARGGKNSIIQAWYNVTRGPTSGAFGKTDYEHANDIHWYNALGWGLNMYFGRDIIAKEKGTSRYGIPYPSMHFPILDNEVDSEGILPYWVNLPECEE